MPRLAMFNLIINLIQYGGWIGPGACLGSSQRITQINLCVRCAEDRNNRDKVVGLSGEKRKIQRGGDRIYKKLTI